MPSADVSPAAGVSVTAGAQVLNRRILIYKGPGILQDLNFRNETVTIVNNLRSIRFDLFLFPTYNQGQGIVFNARNTLSWRPLFRAPPDVNANVDLTIDGEWVPLCAPILLPVGTPSSFAIHAGGADEVAVEILAPPDELPANQGRDRIIVTICAAT